jgi:murein DD-endopeptidase MepM/ murein hydrolase activator NlpD
LCGADENREQGSNPATPIINSNPACPLACLWHGLWRATPIRQGKTAFFIDFPPNFGYTLAAKMAREITFMIVPHNSAKGVVNFRLREWLVYLMIFVFFSSLALVGSSIVYSSMMTRKLIHYKIMLQVNETQKQRIDYFGGEVNSLKRALKELVERDTELRRLLGLRMKDNKTINQMLATTRYQEQFSLLPDTTSYKINKVTNELAFLDDSVKQSRESLKTLQQTVTYLKQRFAVTPSIWPLYGRIVSGFGYRYYPWRGMHTGIDITGWYGNPVRVAANGVVSFAGWKGGFGKCVIVDHGYGVKTLYGHNSKIMVSTGQHVSKGQIISQVGATGFATGPHLHYEIQKNNFAISPMRYLNLDIFTANRVWQ